MEIPIEKGQKELPFYRTLITALIEHAPIGIYMMENGALTYANDSYAKLVGYAAEEIRREKFGFLELVHPDDRLLTAPLFSESDDRRKGAPVRIRTRHKDGHWIYTEIHPSTALLNEKKVQYGTVIDITEQVLAQRQLLAYHEEIKALFIHSPDAIFSLDEHGRFTSTNPRCESLTGYTKDELIHKPFFTLIDPDDLQSALDRFGDAKRFISGSTNLRIIRKDGEKISVIVTHFPVKMDGFLSGTYGIARDTTDQAAAARKMEEFAYADPVTGLPNRKLFEDRLEQTIRFSKDGRLPFAVLSINLNRFKLINDSYGHQLGDDLLVLVTARIQGHLRLTDTLSRFAADQFTLILPETVQEEVMRLIRSIQGGMREPFVLHGHSVALTVSIGIAFNRGKGESAQDLIRYANMAMDHSKKLRTDAYTVYTEEMDLQISYKLQIQRDLETASAKHELELFYQPIMALKTGKLTAMEALIRWNHPRLGYIPPSDFIPVAEECGLILSVGIWVLQTACRQAKKWQASGAAPFKVAVNVSTKQLQQPFFAEHVLSIMKEVELEPAWLELEITESVLLDDVHAIKECLLKLKEAGICISIDDFGTGYTSLNYLREYPFDKVKIDRAFIEDINRDLNGKRIASAIISLAHSLHMDVVAEGIENELQYQYLLGENCNEGQGYYFSRPLPADSLTGLLNRP
ncbi:MULTISPECIES: bifunctional diguanylate cyclase/phosphodiesterase [unclassified Paenibacillus]|uniref:putative bifunctional diguanylate cyclase/phosphodiesterase n=1 Tax=unclassified Paenibacillus TaxID=185978 RepID=UPI00020D7873|nr:MULTISPECIES: bifunctional diguanylate cyclase/phosphodiesterase [unclassified Paenibacillus]EGL19060.1 PAS domain S-box protein [Paenibacillus sp. HGF7]EPD81230.1 PAS domain S-box protein [Paenibacillus sp. HGH0039]